MKTKDILSICKTEIYRLDKHIQENGTWKNQHWATFEISASEITFKQALKICKKLETQFPEMGTESLHGSENLFTLKLWTDNNLEIVKVSPCEQGLLLIRDVTLEWFRT